MTSSMTLAVDLAKTVFEIAIADSHWRIVERHRLSRSQFQQFFFNREPATVVMEACGTAHYWGRGLSGLGFTVRLIPAHYARAAVSTAPALIDRDEIPAPLRAAVLEIISESRALEARIKAVEQQLKQYAAASRDVQRIQPVPGVGLLTATALVAAVGTPANFRDGRHLAAWMGLTPRHVGRGHRMVLGGISKRGDRYLRMLLIHGARSVLIRAQINAKAARPLNRLQLWALDLRQRSNHNKATCTLANKLARISPGRSGPMSAPSMAITAWPRRHELTIFDAHPAVA